MSKTRRRFISKGQKPAGPPARERSREHYYEDRRQRSWTYHDLAPIQPLTVAQRYMLDIFDDGYNLVAYGSPGTGKSFFALCLALNAILDSESKTSNIIIVRSAVPSRDMGFMPGDIEEKIALYETPYRDILYEIVGIYNSYDDMKHAGLIQFCTTSYVRSITWNNAIVIIDEIQNMTFGEIHSVITRLGENSRLVALGDISQNDLSGKRNEQSGMGRFLRIAEKMESVRLVQFTRDDIVRSPLVREWIIAAEDTPE